MIEVEDKYVDSTPTVIALSLLVAILVILHCKGSLTFLMVAIITLINTRCAHCDGTINFVTQHVKVQEKQYEEATFYLKRESSTSGNVFFYCKIMNSTKVTDFVSLTATGQFADGAVSSTCKFTVVEDNIPESNVTYRVEVFIQRDTGSIGVQSTAFVTILLNDDPYGVIQFRKANERVTAQEPLQGQLYDFTSFDVIRLRGTIGSSTVFWQASNGVNTNINDLSPISGFITFSEGESLKQLNISIVSDKVPENLEQFIIDLVNVSGGAVLNSSSSRVFLNIAANDAPVSFTQSILTVSEERTLTINVARGTNAAGLIGDIGIVSTIRYRTVDGSAKGGLDYKQAAGVVTFNARETIKQVEITILRDELPEIAENFTVVLFEPSPGTVLDQPSNATVVIQKSNDPHGLISFENQTQVLILKEGSKNSVQVNRLRGTFGAVTVSWRAMASSRSPGFVPSQVLNHSNGLLTFNPGIATSHISLNAKEDNVPEEAVEFYIRLENVTGGAKLNPLVPEMKVIVGDSDNAYGIITLTSSSENRVDLLTSPRTIMVPVRRTGGALGPVNVNYTVAYLLPGSSAPISEVNLSHPGYVTISTGSFNSTIQIQISENSFLRSDASFLITITSVHLQKKVFTAASSPVIGSPRTAFVNVTSKIANGEVSFFGNPVSLNVNEPPDGRVSNISLLVMRDGVSGSATVSWRISPVSSTFTSRDVSPWHGIIYFGHGVDRVNLTLSIHPDEIPELNEVFTVELTNVTERNERIRPGANQATVTILENDNAGGIFEFNLTGNVILTEGDVRSVDVVRLDGALTTQRVQVTIHAGQNDFISSESILKFNPSQRKSTFYIFTNNDNIPEVNENFTMNLTSIDGTLLGRRTSLIITILQNDDANGLFSFSNSSGNLKKYADEVRDHSQMVSFVIQRQRGTFSSVSVFWNVTSLSGTDVSLDVENFRGAIQFKEGQSASLINVTIRPDIVPEVEERFRVQLTDITGGGRLVEPVMATLIVNPNDAPIHFLHPLKVFVDEGRIANLTIGLNRTLSHKVVVYFSTMDVTTSASPRDYLVSYNQSVVLEIGERRKTISIQTLDDNIPEAAEELVVRLNASTGNTVLIPPLDARVIINANDEPYGIFQFATGALSNVASEGSTVSLEVSRTRGTYKNVSVSWVILSNTRTEIDDNSDFVKAKGTLLFRERSKREFLSIVVREDGFPELNETFYIRLTNVSGSFSMPYGGLLGNRSEATVTVLPSDDPYGVIEFAPSSLQVNVAEDYLPGFVNTTHLNLTVERKKGTLRSAQVIWQLYKASNVPNDAWDLMFYGQRGAGVTESAGRSNSKTRSVLFNTSHASFVSVTPQAQPVSSLLRDGFSLGFWMRPERSTVGTLISKRDFFTNEVMYQLSINSTGSAHFIFRVSNDLYNISLPASVNIFDGVWHPVVLTISVAEFTVYIDGTSILTQRPLTNQVSSADGTIYIGCSVPTRDHYTGALQDVRLYPSSLIPALVREISSTTDKISPINGYLQYQPGMSQKDIFIQTIDNSVPEPETLYVIKLLGLVGEARMGSARSSRIKILKSDNANGGFGFQLSNCQSRAKENDSNISFVVSRSASTFGSVQLNWEIRKSDSSGILASNDFQLASGNVNFLQGEATKLIVIRPKDDSIPELDEYFEVRIISVISTDGTISSTPTSGASIISNSNTCNLTISSNDYPYGVLQITGSIPNGTGIIPVMAHPASLQLKEESGKVLIFVARAQGVQGRVTCEWKTNQVTARGNVDFKNAVGTIEFPAGRNISTIAVEIIDNNVPELGKMFHVQLYNPTGGAVLGHAYYINITILPSDEAYGIFSFANTSINSTVAESSASKATLNIVRTAGHLGTVHVTWRLVNGSFDFALENGSVTFENGRTTSQISIPINDDLTPELTESFIIELTSVSNGKLSTRNTKATIHISGNDDPYGVFEIGPPQARVQENNTTLKLTVSRGGGSLGMVRVSYQTFVPEARSSLVSASPGLDFIAVSDTFDFVEGQTEAIVNITIIGDNSPEPDEYFMVNLTAVRLTGASEYVASSPRIGERRRSEIVIVANDDANGILQLSSSSVTVPERTSANFLNVTRIAGTFGEVSVRFSIINQKNAIIGTDYEIASYEITLVNGQSSSAVPVRILDDDLPEFNESFAIKLEKASLSGGAKLGAPQQCVVTILENDHPYGSIGFAPASLSVSAVEPESAVKLIRLTVLRNGGASGIAQIEWNATIAGFLATDDVTPTSGNVRFLSGQRNEDIQISVKADDIPEDNENVTILLHTISKGKAVIDPSANVAIIHIPANDDPYGVVQFNQSSIMVDERSADYSIYIPIIRTRGLFGTIKVSYSTKNLSPGANSAISGGDYEAAANRHILMGPGVASRNITIKIFKDSIPEVDESFQVEITQVEVVDAATGSLNGRIGNPSAINVTIGANDQPYGLLGIYMKNTGRSGTYYAVEEPGSGTTPVIFEVRRMQGALGSVSVSWRSSSLSSVNVSSDVAGVSGGTFTFLSGQTSKEFIVQVRSDDIPESDESLTIELYDSTGGAIIDPNGQRATLVIKANDGIGGRIGFKTGSRSRTVAEGETASFVVHRTAPAAGNVTVNWTIEGVNATSDFMKTSGTLFLQQGITNVILSIQTLNDSTSESHETFIVRLSDPITSGISSTGAATLVAGDSTATIVIGASDEPHGVIEFASRIQPIKVAENIGFIDLRLVRKMGNIGDVAVHYQVHGIKIDQTTTEGRYGEDFNSTVNHTVIIPDGMDSGTIRVYVIDDTTPEQDEAFYVNITSVVAFGASNITTPPRIGSSSYMQIIIMANDGTQGELAFAPKYQRITVPEDVGSFNVTVIRHKGSFGDVYALYYLNRLTASSDDFDIPGGVMTGGPVKLAFSSGENERNITVIINNDNITETDEHFELGLTLQNAVGNGGIQIGKPDKALIIIGANDDANGVIRFAARSVTQYVSEPGDGPAFNSTATFSIERSKGLFGNVNVQWQLLDVTNASDVSPISGLITFEQNVREKDFLINALADNLPELKKEYYIQLTVVSGGARLGLPSTATLVVAANDEPHGLLSIRSYPSMASSLNVEESTRYIRVVVRRRGGALGTISLQYQTKDGSAISIPGNQMRLAFDQVLDTTSAERFHSFKAYGTEYLLLASSFRKGKVGHTITGTAPNSPYQSTLFRWQGTFVPVFNIKTDGAVKWDSFEDKNITYIVAINHGEVGRLETMSQVMKLHRNETLELVQNITTKGATDDSLFESGGSSYIMIISMKDNGGNTIQQSQLLRWQDSQFILESATVETKGASAIRVFTINGIKYVAVANGYDSAANTHVTASNVYSWSDISKRFNLVQSIQTNGASDVDFMKIGNEHYLFFANSKGGSILYRFKGTTPIGFVQVQELVAGHSGKFFRWNNNDYLVLASNKSILYQWNNSTKSLQNLTEIPVENTLDIQPFSIDDKVAGKLQYLAVTDSSSSKSYLMRLAMLSESADFVPRRGLLTFFEGQTSLNLDLTILPDTRPEMDENFSVEIASPIGGADLASSPNLLVTILSNNNAYGRMAFADSSLNINTSERDWNTVVRLSVLREFGSFGQISLSWNISSFDGRPVTDLYPTQGQVNLNQGISEASIYVNVRADGIAELDERFAVGLKGVTIVGAATSNRGPTINHLKSTAHVTVFANDEPYGVVGWKNRIEITTREKEVNSSVLLIISRSFGTLADIRIYYETVQAANVSQNERVAVPGIDYFAQTSSIMMKRGEREAVVYIKVRHMENRAEMHDQLTSDNNSNVNEIFYVNITGVSLIAGTQVRGSPRVDSKLQKVEVVITEVALNRGSIQFEAPFARRVSESVGVLILSLIRSNGSEGTVGVHYTAQPRNSSLSDFSPQNGLITFSNNQTRANLSLTIVNDNIAELDEVFVVNLVKPSGGVKIGDQNEVVAIISENDYPYGLLSFNVGSRVIDDVIEGQVIQLTVDRSQGIFRSVSVDWSCGDTAQSDLSPSFGTLTFPENATQGKIEIQIINDTIAELTETFTCTLRNPQNGVLISSFNESTITVLPNDKPYGVISVEGSSRQIVVAEPDAGNSGSFFINVVRSVGFDGVVSVQWKLNAISGIDDSNSTFNVTSGFLSFAPGVSIQRIHVQVLNDAKPEESKNYQIYLERTTGGAELDVPASTKSNIIVAASDNPYGTVQFASPLKVNVSEDIGMVNASLVRSGGSIGQLRILFATTNVTATPGLDFAPANGAITFNSGEGTKVIQFSIIADSVPELTEFFTVNLTSVSLITPKTLNQTVINGIQIDTPPMVGPQSTVEISINANDNPFGEVAFLQSEKLVHESDGNISVPVNRTGGTFGTNVVTYTYTDGTASNPTDYTVSGTTLTFAPGERRKFISVQLKDDRLSEFQEWFRLDLSSIAGDGTLGALTRLNVTIETSDNPYGLFGIFNTSLSVFVENPNASRVISFPVYRKDGTLSSSQVSWSVVRSVASASHVSEDVSPDAGVLTFAINERGPKLINITILKSGGPEEPEERFKLQLLSATGDAALDHAFASVSITVSKKGHPNGLFRLKGTVRPTSPITEPQTGATQIAIPVQRDFGTLGAITIQWLIRSSKGSPRDDFLAFNSSLTFANGEKSKEIFLAVIGDNVPEIDETFQVSLVSANNGAEINALKSKVNFTIRANDYPHGLFDLNRTSQRFEFVPASSTRLLHFEIYRNGGTIGNVQCIVTVRYMSDGSSVSHAVNFTNGQASASTTFAIAPGRFLGFGSNITVSLQSVFIIGIGSSMPPAIMSASSTLVIVVPESAANSIIEFDASTRYPTASATNQVSSVRVTRRGLFGSVSINWRSGYPPGSFTVGTITPSQGSVSLRQGERSQTISFRIELPSILQNQLIYSVYLTSPSPAQGQPGWPKIGSSYVAVVDPHGLVEIAPSSLNVTVTEGNKAAIVVRRLLSTVGTIRVSFTTQPYIGSDAATQGLDYTAVSSTFDMINGQTLVTINVDTLEDNVGLAEKDEYFYVVLTSAQIVSSVLSASSPRISMNSRASVKIRDNDNPFGTVSFTAQSLTPRAQESIGHVMLQIVRTGGVFSRATALVRSIGGGETWQSQIINDLPASSDIRNALNARTQAASAVPPNHDYFPVNREIVFEELNAMPSGGQIKTVNVSISRDSISEPAEQIVIIITNVTGGASLPSISNPLKHFSIITIDGNGLWNGEIGFTQNFATVNEDGSGKVILPMERKGGSAQNIEVNWVVWSTAASISGQVMASSGVANFAAGNATSSIIINLRQDLVPEFASWFYVNLSTSANGAVITSGRSGLFANCNVTMLQSDYPAGRIGFNQNYRFPVVTLNDESKDIRVKRYGGTLKAVTVLYQTTALVSPVVVGDIVMTPARENQDFTPTAGQLSFPLGSTEAIINIKLTPEKASSSAYPKVFNITLMSPTNGAVLYDLHKSEQVVISRDSSSAKFLSLRSSALRIPLTDREIENILKEMLQLVKTTLHMSRMQQGLVMQTFRVIMSYKASQPSDQLALSNNTKSLMLDVYEALLSPSRTDTRGESQWSLLLDDIAYTFLNGMRCPYTFTGTRANFGLTARRDFGKNLNGIKFTSKRNADFFRYPVNIFSSSSDSPCTDIHFIDYGNQQFFSSGKSILNSKVMSSKIKSGLSSGMKVVYRVYTPKMRVAQVGTSCVIWKHPVAGVKGDWTPNKCKLKGKSTNYVECECQHLSEYAVIALSDDRTGYEIYFMVACFICIGACFFALVVHHLPLTNTTFTADLLMHFLFAIMMSNILFVVAAYISPTLAEKATECGVLALSLHYFVLAQFSNMFAQACNLWRIFVINDEYTNRKYLHFFIIGWGAPVVIIVGYVLITYAAYRWPFAAMYGYVNVDGDMCFMKNIYAALGSVIFPAILLLLGVMVVLVQSYHVKSQWKCYEDLYRGTHNFKEMRHVLAVFTLLCITWLFAGLHLAYGSLWLIIAFTVFNVILGLYILIVYALMRIRKLCYCLPNATPSTASYKLTHASTSSNHSARNLVESHSKLSDWADVELPISLNPMDFPDSMRIIESPDVGRGRDRGIVNESYDVESDEFDDLIFALKTEEEKRTPSPRPVSADQPQIRRIKIADTHL